MRYDTDDYVKTHFRRFQIVDVVAHSSDPYYAEKYKREREASKEAVRYAFLHNKRLKERLDKEALEYKNSCAANAVSY